MYTQNFKDFSILDYKLFWGDKLSMIIIVGDDGCIGINHESYYHKTQCIDGIEFIYEQSKPNSNTMKLPSQFCIWT